MKKELQKKLAGLTNQKLLLATREVRSREREALAELLYHLSEVERRLLYAVVGYSSLHEFCVKELGYDDASANRRVMASRAFREAPQLIDASIRENKVNLTSLASMQRHIQRQRRMQKSVSKEETKTLFRRIQGKSARETERMIYRLDPTAESRRHERIKQVSANLSEVRFNVDEKLRSKIERLKKLYFHKNPDPSLSELMDWIVEAALEKHDPLRREARREKTTQRRHTVRKVPRPKSPTPPRRSSGGKRVAIPSSIRDRVYKRDQGTCRYRGPSGRLCGQNVGVQVDHRIPVSKGGTNDSENLQLLCWKHNQMKGAG